MIFGLNTIQYNTYTDDSIPNIMPSFCFVSKNDKKIVAPYTYKSLSGLISLGFTRGVECISYLSHVVFIC